MILPLAFELFSFRTVGDWIGHYGYGALFGLLFSCGCGLPLPEDVPLIASGILIFHGKMNILIAAPVAWCGILAGDTILYTLGFYLGHNVTKLPVIGHHVNQQRLERCERLFVKYGVWVVFIGRMFMGIRGAMVVAAGTSRFKYFKFLIVDGMGAVVSGGLFLFLGYWGAERGPELWEKVREVRQGLFIAASIAAIVLIAFIWMRARRPVAKQPDQAETTAK